MRPTVKLYCLSAVGEEVFNRLHKAIVQSFVKFKELEVKDENDLLCLFVPDMMTYGLGDEVLVEVDLPKRLALSKPLKDQLATAVAGEVIMHSPVQKFVEVRIYEFDEKKQGYAKIASWGIRPCRPETVEVKLD